MQFPNILGCTDGYKVGHAHQLPEDLETTFLNMTARGSKIPGIDHVVFFGLQYFVKEFLQRRWQEEFFNQPVDAICAQQGRRARCMGIEAEGGRIRALHALGHLPLEIRALPEGSRVPVGVPMMVMWNTHPDFAWLPGYLETQTLGTLWGPCTTATVADMYRGMLDDAGRQTGMDPATAAFQAHDFSARGMFGMDASTFSGLAHLTSFSGTESLMSVDAAEAYYNANAETDNIAGTVPATEHSVMSTRGQSEEPETYRALLQDLYPSGIVSIVSDTWDYWNVWKNILPPLKDTIMQRDGKMVIRPDSGDPIDIMLGNPDAPAGSPENMGSYETAWQLFGGTQTRTGHRLLDPHVGLIYGDTITPGRCRRILRGLIQKGFAPDVIFGIGASTYQKLNRDTFMFAMKVTAAWRNGRLIPVFKDPKTDKNHGKRSHKGLLAVHQQPDGEFWLEENVQDLETVLNCAFQPVFRNGELQNEESFTAIRKRLAATRAKAWTEERLAALSNEDA